MGFKAFTGGITNDAIDSHGVLILRIAKSVTTSRSTAMLERYWYEKSMYGWTASP